MSLKVLLADDSAAIKKVVQLSLQDFGVELKTVGSGKDVLEVAKSFNPDIALVDVLLPHKTGYEIAAEIKRDPNLKKTPVVMLWSSFMAFDEEKFKASGADDKLEKPFEVGGLRSLITKYVPKTQSSPLLKHLEFPHLDFDLASGAVTPSLPSAPPSQAPPPPPTVTPVQQKDGWTMSSFDDISSGPQADLSKTLDLSKTPTDSEWVRKDLGKFNVQIPDEEEPIPFQYPEQEIKNTNFLFKASDIKEKEKQEKKEEHLLPDETGRVQLETITNASLPSFGQTHSQTDIGFTPIDTAPKISTTKPVQASTPKPPDIPEALSNEIRSQAREIIEKIVWKVVPEIATNIVKQELERLLNEDK